MDDDILGAGDCVGDGLKEAAMCGTEVGVTFFSLSMVRGDCAGDGEGRLKRSIVD